MALDSGPLPVATEGSVALTDFNTAMAQLDAAFPLETVNIKDGNVTSRKIAPTIVADLGKSGSNIGTGVVEVAAITFDEAVNYQVLIFAAMWGRQSAVASFVAFICKDDVEVTRVSVTQQSAWFLHVSPIWYEDNLSGSKEFELKIQFSGSATNEYSNTGIVGIAFAT